MLFQSVYYGQIKYFHCHSLSLSLMVGDFPHSGVGEDIPLSDVWGFSTIWGRGYPTICGGGYPTIWGGGYPTIWGGGYPTIWSGGYPIIWGEDIPLSDVWGFPTIWWLGISIIWSGEISHYLGWGISHYLGEWDIPLSDGWGFSTSWSGGILLSEVGDIPLSGVRNITLSRVEISSYLGQVISYYPGVGDIPLSRGGGYPTICGKFWYLSILGWGISHYTGVGDILGWTCWLRIAGNTWSAIKS